MNLESIRKYCAGKNGNHEDFPFGNDTLVLKIGSRIYALINIDSDPISINLKCDPFLAMHLREKYPEVTPGYHMNKIHWNTVKINGEIPDSEILAMIDHSYELVLKKLTMREKKSIKEKK